MIILTIMTELFLLKLTSAGFNFECRQNSSRRVVKYSESDCPSLEKHGNLSKDH